MAQEIYNEGRVVGLSAYEIFVKQVIANGVDPSDIPTESQWLTSMIGSGASMVLKLNAGTTSGVHDYELPSGSNLTVAGVVIGSPFIGDGEFESGWAKKITSYGALIENDNIASPTSTNVPSTTYKSKEYRDNVAEFAKITDGIVYTKTATWIPTGTDPAKDIDPNFNISTTVVRLYLDDILNNDVMVLLTGFNNKRILQGLSGFATDNGSGISECGSTDTVNNDWINGGLLGPEMIPWASKIIFSVPSSTYSVVSSVTRTIPKGVNSSAVTKGSYNFTNLQDSKVKSNTVVDFNSIDLTQYYTVHSSDFNKTPTITETVQDVGILGNSANSLVAWYPGITATELNSPSTDNTKIFPPALYATKITSTGDKTLVPLDVAAPGTVKGFKTATEATNYTNLMQDNFAMYYDTTNNTYTFVAYNRPTSGTAKIAYIGSSQQTQVEITAGDNKVKTVALNSYDSSTSTYTDYLMTGAGGDLTTSPLGKFHWGTLLDALKSNKYVDTLGNRLRNIGTEVNASNTIGISSSYANKLTNLGTDKLTITGSTPVEITASSNLATFANGKSVKVGTNFIEFGNGKRLYIETDITKVPTSGVPVGSIGIGW